MNRKILLVVIVGFMLAIGIFLSINSTEESANGANLKASAADNQFVGDQQCASCHSKETEAWEESHHDYAMKAVDEYSVRGDFSDVTFSHHGDSYRFFRKDSLYMVEVPDSAGNRKAYEVTHTFGWEPLQQYLIDFGQGKLQALNIAWDTEKEEWFALNPEEDLQHGDWMHWSGGAMNWNSMCADCHSTNLQKNYIAEEDSFHTTWSDINVSCESCHGPGKNHVDFVESEKVEDATVERIRRDLKLTGSTSQNGQINQCAQCHSLREEVTDDYRHEGDFLNHFNPTLPQPPAYFADGQIREEVYVYGSFLQSKMFKEGVECTDCHDPHTLELKANISDNSLCMDCHEPSYNTPDHHFHEPNTEATQCISCHMPGRYYMEMDFRRDHSFRVPRPDLSKTFDTPNACNDCHDDRSASWTAEAVEEWYGPNRPNHFSETLLKADSLGPEAISDLKKLVGDTSQPDIARATAVNYIGSFSGDENIELLGDMTRDEDPLVRNSAARALSETSGDQKYDMLEDVLDDSLRVVRLGAVVGLSELPESEIQESARDHFAEALDEYRQYLKISQYFPQGQMNRGQFYERQGEEDKAIEAYQKALEKDPQFNPARTNLAYIYNKQGDNAKAKNLLQTVVEQEPNNGSAHYSLALLLSEEGDLRTAVTHFEKAAELMPENSRVLYNLAIAMQRLERPKESEQAYLKAIDHTPENVEYRYGLCTLYIQQEQYEKALPHAKKLEQLSPNNPNIQKIVRLINSRAN